MTISVCIATYRRAERLAALLGDLTHQQLLPQEVVVVDNDAAGSAWAVVEQARSGAPFPIRYTVQPVKNLSLTRNQTVAWATCDWLAFVDDDERAPTHWLARLAEAAVDVDGVLGPVLPVLPEDAVAWLRHGRFYDWARMKTGSLVPGNRLRFGNVLLRASLLRVDNSPFDPAYGCTGGEDGDLLNRLVQGGARIIWCDEAEVFEPVEAKRLKLRWLLLRALRGGQDYARHALAGRYGTLSGAGRALLFARALSQMIVALLLALLCWPLGRHRAVHWLSKAAANLGKLSSFAGFHYREYA
ncbi:glycosyltransferase family 2 protein [uncultured Nevskia sp.]|uniref:glycosyltransferase family 2 protein n=1 Tax=uncultured Nevskia sp. TaxID=228950 RepID=UPI0025DDBFD7|nr:glycosyltransferase family 2 protein [uncultured Nevskia sp.]